MREGRSLAGPPATWRKRVLRTLADLPLDWDFCFLYRCFDLRHRIRRLTPRLVVPFCPQGGAAYAVSREGARKLLAAVTPISTAIDRHYARLVSSGQVRAYAASPMLVLPGRHPSIINRENATRRFVEGGINRPPEFWPDDCYDYLGEPLSWWRRLRVRASFALGSGPGGGASQ